MYTQHIILDLEMNPVAKCNKDAWKNLRRETIEIGAVKLTGGYEIMDRFRCFVKPKYNEKITPFITTLTGIRTADVGKAVSFEEAIREFEEWIGYADKTRIYSWSDSDLNQIKKECAYKGMTVPPNMGRWIDFQAIYPHIMGYDITYRQEALRAAAEQFGIVMDKKQSHSALYDAEITTELVVSVLTGRYRKQAEILRKAAERKENQNFISLGEICGGMLQQFFGQMQTELEVGR